MTEPVQSPKDALLRRIGRNVVNFQKLEVCLKRLTPLPARPLPVSALARAAKKHAKSMRRLPLGQAANRFNESYYEKEPSLSEEQLDAPGEALITISHHLDDASGEAIDRRQDLLALVKERNRLVHHDLAEFDFGSPEACDALSVRLDEQNARLLDQLAYLKIVRDDNQAAMRSLQAFVESEEFMTVLTSTDGQGA